ncbi:MAG: L,D-transpeptidase [Acidobacteriota bacterium]
MRTIRNTTLGLIVALSTLAAGCTTGPGNNTSPITSGSPAASPSTSPSPGAVSKAAPVTLPVLDALLSDDAFKTKLKANLELSDDQMAGLQKIASDEVARLHQTNVEEQTTDQSLQSEQSREHAAQAIRDVIGEQKTAELFAFASDYWVAGNQGTENKNSSAEAQPAVPNSIPKDTRVVVNIPAFRMDVFKNGALVKSYKIGIGYPEFPLPTGLRKAETIIFNPTWTPPDEPWVAKMKNVSVGEKVEAGSKLNPLGPIKIPIGAPSLIHGGKSLAKIGTFASHGCVGLTTPQVKDFAKVLAEAGGTELTDAKIQSYLKNPTRTQALKLSQVVPVELRYETIVLEDGRLHIYRDVYAQDTNTEEDLRAVLEANGIKLEDLSEGERTQVLDALNAMSRHPLKSTAGGKSAIAAAPSPSPTGATSMTDNAGKKAATRKPITKNQKEVVIEVAALKGKGYPAAVNLDNGTGKPAVVAEARSAH